MTSDGSEGGKVGAVRNDSEDRYRVLFENSRDAMMVLAPPEWQFVSANAATLRLFGAEDEATFVALTPWEVSPALQPDGRPSAEKSREMIDIALREGAHCFEWRHQHLSGQELLTSVQLTRLEFAGQTLVQATVRDLTPTERSLSALRDSETRLQLAVEATGFGTYCWDHAAGKPTYSPEFLALYDLPPDGTVALGPDLIPLAVVDEDRPVFQAAMAAGNDPGGDGVMKADYRIRRSDGSIRWLMARGRTEFEGARPSRSAGIIMDITERKQAEETLRRYELLASHGRDVVLFVRRSDGRVLEANRAALDAYGYGRDELLSLSIRDLRAPDARPLTEAQMALVNAGGLRFETVHQRKDGRSFPVEVSSEGVTVGGVRMLMSVVRDISDRKRADETIALLKRSIDVHYDAAYWFDSDGKFIYANETGYKALGIEPGDLIGRTLQEVNPNATAERMKDVWKKLRTDGHYWSESFHRRKDGSEFPVEILTSYVQFGDKEYACGFARDITKRKAAEAETVRLTSQLQQAQKIESVGRLAGGVAHDFNNMLGVILGHCELALEKVDPTSSLHGDLVNIQTAAQRSADLTRQLLAFARKQTVAPKVLQLNDTVVGMLKMVKRLIGEDVQLDWQPGENQWPVRIDPTQIDQILANLCVNARDAIADVGRITIATGSKVMGGDAASLSSDAKPGEYVWLAVSDDGCGMNQNTMAQVFEPFFTTKEVGKGTGLGLATVYGIVKQNDGFIHLRSELGQGTIITVYLPRYVGKDAQDRGNAAAAEVRPGLETILLVEDEAAFLNVVQGMLEKRGYRVLGASTPGQAVQIAREHNGNIDLLITDVVMPEMNGRDLARIFLSLYPQGRRLFMSGYTADVIAHQGILDEGVFFIQKPFSASTLAATVRGVLDAVQPEKG